MKAFLRRLLDSLPAGLRLAVQSCVMLLMQRSLYYLKLGRAAVPASAPREKLAALQRQVATVGYAVVPNFKSRAWCEQARSEVLRTMESAAVTTRHTEDLRVFGIENLCATAAQFASDPLLSAIASSHARSQQALVFCMANRVEYRDGVAYGSGGEWHRDSFHCELKAMLYLTDVKDSDGPFAIVKASHRLWQIVRDVLLLASRDDRDFLRKVSPTRLKDAGTYLSRRDPGRVARLTAEQGTLLVFDASAIHTGTPPLPGGALRLALTNYYCPQADVAAARAYYQPMVKLN